MGMRFNGTTTQEFRESYQQRTMGRPENVTINRRNHAE